MTDSMHERARRWRASPIGGQRFRPHVCCAGIAMPVDPEEVLIAKVRHQPDAALRRAGDPLG
jgi:hypothetical protein